MTDERKEEPYHGLSVCRDPDARLEVLQQYLLGERP